MSIIILVERWRVAYGSAPPFTTTSNGHVCAYARLADRYRREVDEAGRARPPIVVIDELLSERARAALTAHCHDATAWNHVKPGGYLGGYLWDGFAPPVLRDVAMQVERRRRCRRCRVEHRRRRRRALSGRDERRVSAARGRTMRHGDRDRVAVLGRRSVVSRTCVCARSSARRC